MSNPRLNEIVTTIAKAPPVPDMTTRIIGIDGLGGAGKSTLAASLAPLLDAKIIHTDDFASWDNALNWHERLLAQVLTPLSQNTPGRYQRYDWGSRRLAEWHDVQSGGTIILEGVSSLRAAFRPMQVFGIFVETPQPERLRRGLIRDGADMHEQWITWQTVEDTYITDEAPQDFANIVIAGTLPIC